MIQIKNIPWLLLFCLVLPDYALARDINVELINAARAGNVTEVRDLIAEGADINAKNAAGKTVLMVAANLGNARIVDILLSEGADVNAKDNLESTALIAAAYKGNLHILKALLAQGADVNAESKNGVTALSTAKTVGYQQVVSFLEEAANAKSGGSDKSGKSKHKPETKSKRSK